ncbi:atherin-like [Lagenorhynchus albirostris]|uniref:atherin-like n=1 Tax=Lagenorhynchus albirostris TaxID=27610 RepID=UPI0028EDDEE1|nr:atherin-like [Lagenorhynchus albirostris]
MDPRRAARSPDLRTPLSLLELALSLTWTAAPPVSSPHGSHDGPQACTRASPAKSPPAPPTPPASNRTPSQGVPPGAHSLGALATSPSPVVHHMEPPPSEAPFPFLQGQHLLPPGLSSNRLHAGGPMHRPFFLRRLGGEGQEAGPQRHYRCCPGQSTQPRFPCL